ncbi:MAG: unnamed protein product [uncultured Caballeronia sp.]|nr:MAG: unnamed protein product [uncultured Caballeronia sp.]
MSDLLGQENAPANVWIGEPKIVDWEAQIGYSFSRTQKATVHPTLQIETLRDWLSERSVKPTVEALRALKIHVIDVN